MTVLHLGVIEQPYDSREPMPAAAIFARLKAGKPPKRRAVQGTTTTGDVATILEAKCGVMAAFMERRGGDVARAMENSVAGALETALMTGNLGASPFAAAEGDIEELFKDFLATKEIETMGLAGVPTKAALRGVNHRMAHPYAKRDPRPSFIDTSLYQASFKAWFD
jgi:hypothetical protein